MYIYIFFIYPFMLRKMPCRPFHNLYSLVKLPIKFPQLTHIIGISLNQYLLNNEKFLLPIYFPVFLSSPSSIIYVLMSRQYLRDKVFALGSHHIVLSNQTAARCSHSVIYAHHYILCSSHHTSHPFSP